MNPGALWLPAPGPLQRLLGRLRQGRGRIVRMSSTYRFLKLLGEGGMGQVWLAEKIGAAGFSKLAAIKTIRKERVADRRVLEMFMDEARLVANLVHPNIVQVYHLFRTRREVFIVMEHVFGVTLLEVLDRLRAQRRRMPPEMGAYVVSRICHGLYYAHRKTSRDGHHLGIVHRDICPSNILISYRGIPKLGDFGVAKARSSNVDDEGNVVWGKYPYMAPEAVRRHGTDPRSDIYALGLVLFEMFTGLLAHAAPDTATLKDILSQESRESLDVRRREPDFPEPLAKIILKATEYDPGDRYQDAHQMGTDLEQFLLAHFLFPDEEKLSEYMASLFPTGERHRWW